MKRRVILTTTIISLILAIGQADYGNFILAGLLAIYPALVLIANMR